MEKQFKIFSSAKRPLSENLAEEEIVNADTQITPAIDAQALSTTPSALLRNSSRIQEAGTREQDIFSDPAKLQTQRIAVPDQRSSSENVWAAQESSGSGLSAYKEESRLRPRTARTKQKQRARSTGSNIAVLSGLLCLLLLTASGYWLYQTRANSSATTPVATPTQVTYTIVEPASTTIPTATPSAVATVGSPRVPAIVPPTPTPAPTSASTPAPTPTPAPTSTPSQVDGQRIVVSISKQSLTAYEKGKVVLTSLVTTGMPSLYTPLGTYHIIGRVANVMFTSPWPKSSPNYYAPIHVNYGLQLTTSGIYLHDATWRSEFGPGTNVPHTDPVHGQQTGSHGCVELPLDAMTTLYSWALNGIVVEIVN